MAGGTGAVRNGVENISPLGSLTPGLVEQVRDFRRGEQLPGAQHHMAPNTQLGQVDIWLGT